MGFFNNRGIFSVHLARDSLGNLRQFKVGFNHLWAVCSTCHAIYRFKTTLNLTLLVTEVKPKNPRYQSTEADLDLAGYELHTA